MQEWGYSMLTGAEAEDAGGQAAGADGAADLRAQVCLQRDELRLQRVGKACKRTKRCFRSSGFDGEDKSPWCTSERTSTELACGPAYAVGSKIAQLETGVAEDAADAAAEAADWAGAPERARIRTAPMAIAPRPIATEAGSRGSRRMPFLSAVRE